MSGAEVAGTRKRSVWRAVWAGVLTFFAPGLGHVYAGAWRPGMMLLGVSVAVTWGIRLALFASRPRVMLLPFVVFCVVGSVAVLALMFDAGRRARRPASGVRPWFRSTGLAFVGFLLLAAPAGFLLPFRWGGYSIPSGSNIPTLMVGDVVMADKRMPPAGGLRNRMVIFYPPGLNQPWVKRAVGLAGDTVQMKQGVLYINDQAAARVAVGDFEAPDASGALVLAHEYQETLPGGGTHLILKYSDEGRHDPVNKVDANNTDVYTVPAGTVFLLGDNRDNSMDSRYPSVGFVPVERIIGVADVVYWAHDWERVGMRVE